MGKATKKHTFYVVAEMTISVGTEVEADTEEEARKIAEDRAPQTLCHQCSSATESRKHEWCTSGELDGEPTIIAVEQLR